MTLGPAHPAGLFFAVHDKLSLLNDKFEYEPENKIRGYSPGGRCL